MMPRLQGNEGDRTVEYWAVQHYNDPATTTRGYQGWHFSNSDLFPADVYHWACECWQKTGHHGFLSLEIAEKALEILQTRLCNMQTGPYERTMKLPFGDSPLRIVKVVQSISVHPVSEGKERQRPKRREKRADNATPAAG